MNPIRAAMEAHRPSDPYERLCARVREAGRLRLDHVTQTVIRDRALREAMVARAVSEGLIRIEVVPTGAHPRTDLVWSGDGQSAQKMQKV